MLKQEPAVKKTKGSGPKKTEANRSASLALLIKEKLTKVCKFHMETILKCCTNILEYYIFSLHSSPSHRKCEKRCWCTSMHAIHAKVFFKFANILHSTGATVSLSTLKFRILHIRWRNIAVVNFLLSISHRFGNRNSRWQNSSLFYDLLFSLLQLAQEIELLILNYYVRVVIALYSHLFIGNYNNNNIIIIIIIIIMSFL